MPAYLKAFVVVLVLSIVMLWYLRGTMVPGVFSSEDFERRRKLWLLVTCIAFLASNFWLYAVLCFLVCFHAKKKDANPLALYVFLMFAVPPMSRVIPGVGFIEYIIPLYHERILTFAILVPMALHIRAERAARPAELRFADLAVVLLMAYQLLRAVFQLPVPGVARHALYLVLDIGVVYYVASRAAQRPEQFREIIGAFVAAMGIMALVALVETGKSWWLYESLATPFGSGGSYYATRGDLGLLRAKAALGHPIALGYALGVALMLMHALFDYMGTRARRLGMTALLGAALLVTFSRGPWVGTVGGLMYLMVSGPGKGKRITTTLALGALTAGVLALTPFGRSLYGMLPFVGHVDAGSITYRQNLWEVSLVVLKQNLWLGDMNYIANPLMEVMRQGEGIIDMVNSYLQISLAYGIIGLALFLLCMFRAWRGVRHRRLNGHFSEPDQIHMRRGFRAALVTIGLTIATVSNISFVPITYWLVMGLCVGYGAMAAAEAAKQPAWTPGLTVPTHPG